MGYCKNKTDFLLKVVLVIVLVTFMIFVNSDVVDQKECLEIRIFVFFFFFVMGQNGDNFYPVFFTAF